MRISNNVNIKHPWLIWVPLASYLFGAALNAIVMTANQGLMPVQIPGGVFIDFARMDDFRHVTMTSASHLKFLADWISTGNAKASIGDLFIWACDLVFPFCTGAWAALQFEKD
jgi:hypothetical protein